MISTTPQALLFRPWIGSEFSSGRMSEVGWLILLMLLGCAGEVRAAGRSAEVYAQEIRPLLQQFCLKCHSTEQKEGELDLEQFTTYEQIQRHPKAWQGVLEQVGNGEMPPKKKPQPSAEERQRLLEWVRTALGEIAASRAGDPGPVVLRRLNNVEYTHTIQDLTGVPLTPAREFPGDSAAGEGFVNTGNALVMSPALFSKYLDAAKEVASHAVLLQDGIRFSVGATRRDWTDEALGRVKAIYLRYADAEGRIPLEKYLSATLEHRGAFKAGRKTLVEVAQDGGLSPVYLAEVWTVLNATEPSLILDGLRERWRNAAPQEAPALATDIRAWQKALFQFGNVGHMKPWQSIVNPSRSETELRLKLVAGPDSNETRFFLSVSDAGDGKVADEVVIRSPRLTWPGRVPVLLRDVRGVVEELKRRRSVVIATVGRCLEAASEAIRQPSDLAELARRHGVDVEVLGAWFDYLGLGNGGAVTIENYFTKTYSSSAGYDFIKGWGDGATPNLSANSSDQHVRVPGNMKPHSVAVHPSPTLNAAIGWRSPTNALFRIEATVTHAHPECGNGVTWSLELRRGAVRQRLANGVSAGGKPVKVGPLEMVSVREGDLISMLIGPRDGNHACDLTALDWTLSVVGSTGSEGVWDLGRDVSKDVLAGNPHADSQGRAGIWHFYTEPVAGGGELAPVIPSGSLLARWQAASGDSERTALGGQIAALLAEVTMRSKDTPDGVLQSQILSLGGPLLSRFVEGASRVARQGTGGGGEGVFGLDAGLFGKTSGGQAVGADDLCLRAPALMEVRVPADFAAGAEFVASGALHPEAGREGSVQVRVTLAKSADGARLDPTIPILTLEGSTARQRVEKALSQFRSVFPAALCYGRVVPVDEVITIALFHREDEHYGRLMLSAGERAELDRAWEDLRFISQDALRVVDGYAQLMEFATQDSDPKLFEPLRKPIHERAEVFRKSMVAAEPFHLAAIPGLASKAYRRPLNESESRELTALYGRFRSENLSHEESFRLVLARILVAPAFLYRLEKVAEGARAGAVSDWEMASRLSYFLWSSMPDGTLRAAAEAGRLRDPDGIATQARRMLRDGRVRRLATEFACQWLHIRDFDTLDEKSERHFPTFTGLRADMYEESIRFFTDLFQHNGSVLDVIDADHTFVNGALAKHYGMRGVEGETWRRVEGLRAMGRGGVLGFASVLSKQAGASRTSPILRGNWFCEVLLGDKLPRPPKDVPRLPEDEAATEGLTMRQLVEKHSTDTRCSGCHVRIDPFGYALEGYDAIGRRRERDLGDRPIDTRAVLLDGTRIDGLKGLKEYVLNQRRDAFLKQFCRKLLGYALGRAVQLSDEPLLAEMREKLRTSQYSSTLAVELIVRSPQFRNIRGRDESIED